MKAHSSSLYVPTLLPYATSHLMTHLTGNFSHVGLAVIFTSEFGTRELADSFPNFQRPGWIELPSHLLSLTRIQAFCTLRFYMAFIQDGTALAYYYPNFVLRIWDITDLPLMDMSLYCKACQMDQDDELLFWVPVEHREDLYMPSPRAVPNEVNGPELL